MPLFRIRFAEGALDRLATNGVPWLAVLFVLQQGHPSVREHLGRPCFAWSQPTRAATC